MDAHDEYKLDKEADEAHNDEAQCGLQADLVELCRAKPIVIFDRGSSSHDLAIAYCFVITCAGSCPACSRLSEDLHPG